MLTVFRNYKGTGVAGVTKLRGSADAAVLLVKKFNVCGIGYMRGWNGLPVSATQKGCSLGYYTVGHELGHNMGALHDKLQGANTYYSVYEHFAFLSICLSHFLCAVRPRQARWS